MLCAILPGMSHLRLSLPELARAFERHIVNTVRVNRVHTVSTDSLPKDCPHRLRSCHLRLENGVAGYGFTMNTGTAPLGQFIGEVNHHSPAERAGLLAGDRVVEVNGVNVETDSHSEVNINIVS